MKKLSVVLSLTALLVSLLGGPRATSSALASPLPEQPASLSRATTATGGNAILSIPAAAFTPYEDGYNYANEGRYLKHFSGHNYSTNDGLYYAAVELPQAAVVTRVTYHFYDTYSDSASGGEIELQRNQLDQDTYEPMAVITVKNLGQGDAVKSENTIATPTIDNLFYTYWLVLDLPISQAGDDQQIWGCGVTIEYIPPVTPTGVLSIPAAAFIPDKGGVDYENHGRYLYANGYPGSTTAWFLAAVQLPQGATVTTLYFHWYDFKITDGVAHLYRTKVPEDTTYGMTEVSSGGTVGYGASYTHSIDFAMIDNSKYTYWLEWEIPVGADFRGCAVVIEYTLPAPGAGGNIISIPAASFRPYAEGYDYYNGLHLEHMHAFAQLNPGSYYAPLNLPQGATVTWAAFYLYDTYPDGSGGEVDLQRTRFGLHNYVNLAKVPILNFNQGYVLLAVSNIDHASIDNSKYGYWVVWDLPPSQGANQDLYACGVIIDYTYRLYLPVLQKNH